MPEFIEMPGGLVGGDTDQQREFAYFLTQQSLPRFDEIISEINERISSTVWSGRDAKVVAAEWQRTQETLRNVFTSQIQAMSQKALAQAQAQEQVSAL